MPTNNATPPLLDIRDLHVEVDGKAILNGLTLAVRKGEIHAIMGPNGSGKSTLAHVLAGREGYTVTKGSVQYEGRDLLGLEPEERARAGVQIKVVLDAVGSSQMSGGLIEFHFHFFVMVAVISLYQDWVPFLLTIAYVGLHHGIMGVLDPASVYNHADAWV
ncbi:MAG: ATP-binding cassette domain-containing protein, partial [Thermoplasmatota archaeon]